MFNKRKASETKRIVRKKLPQSFFGVGGPIVVLVLGNSVEIASGDWGFLEGDLVGGLSVDGPKLPSVETSSCSGLYGRVLIPGPVVATGGSPALNSNPDKRVSILRAGWAYASILKMHKVETRITPILHN